MSSYFDAAGQRMYDFAGKIFPYNRSLTGEAMTITALDTFVALMAGVIILPACFAYGISPDKGPSLLFYP